MDIGLITYSLSEKSGARAPIRIAEYLRKRNHLVTVYALDYLKDSNLQTRLEQQGIKIKLYKTNSSTWLPFPLRGYLVIPKLLKDLRRSSHSILSFHATVPFMVAARLSGKKLLTTYYGTELSYYRIQKEAGLEEDFTLVEKVRFSIFDQALLLQQRIIFKLSENIVSISKFLASEASRYFNKDLDVIYLGTDQHPESKIGDVKDEEYLLSVSRIVPYKGFHLIIKAFKKAREKYPNFKLVIVGSVANPDYLKELKLLADDHVVFKQNVSDLELSDLYSRCSFYVTGDLWVPWSLTPLEAGYYQKPTVALKFGAMGEIIENDVDGFLALGVDGLAQKMAELMADKRRRIQMGAEAALLGKKFSWPKTAAEYEKRLLQIIES